MTLIFSFCLESPPEVSVLCSWDILYVSRNLLPSFFYRLPKLCTNTSTCTPLNLHSQRFSINLSLSTHDIISTTSRIRFCLPNQWFKCRIQCLLRFIVMVLWANGFLFLSNAALCFIDVSRYFSVSFPPAVIVHKQQKARTGIRVCRVTATSRVDTVVAVRGVRLARSLCYSFHTTILPH